MATSSLCGTRSIGRACCACCLEVSCGPPSSAGLAPSSPTATLCRTHPPRDRGPATGMAWASSAGGLLPPPWDRLSWSAWCGIGQRCLAMPPSSPRGTTLENGVLAMGQSRHSHGSGAPSTMPERASHPLLSSAVESRDHMASLTLVLESFTCSTLRLPAGGWSVGVAIRRAIGSIRTDVHLERLDAAECIGPRFRVSLTDRVMDTARYRQDSIRRRIAARCCRRKDRIRNGGGLPSDCRRSQGSVLVANLGGANQSTSPRMLCLLPEAGSSDDLERFPRRLL